MKLLTQVPSSAILVHGTSFEAIETLLITGKLPKAKNEYYYFQVIGENFSKSRFYLNKLNYPEGDINDIFSLNLFYAIENGRKHFLQKQLQKLPSWITNAVLNSRQDWESWLNGDESNLDLGLAKKLSIEIMKRKGVLILPSESFLSRYKYEYVPPHDGIRFRCCNQLSKNDISYVVPQGKVEKEMLLKYF